MLRRLNRIFPLLIIIGLTLLFFYKLAFTDMILARGDTYVYFYPYWDARNAAMQAGQLPLWTPDIFMGAPLLANPQLGTFYPLNWLTIPLTAPDAIRISILIHIALAASGMFLLFRSLQTEKRIIPALMAAILFAFGGYLSAHVEQINQLQGLAWMPWLFFLYRRVLVNEHGRDGSRPYGDHANTDGASGHGTPYPYKPILYGCLLAIVLALQIFSGHTQTVFISGLGLAIYGIGFAIGAGHDRAQRVVPLREYGKYIVGAMLILGVVGLLAIVLALPQIVPTLELTALSNRGGGFTPQQATAFSLAPSYVGRGLLPAYEGQLFGEYVATIGVIGLGLALLGIFTRHEKREQILWILLAAIGLGLALGRFNPIYLILSELPGFNFFRVPARFLSLFALGSAVLAGMGTQALLDGNRPARRVMLFIVAILAGLILATRYIFEINAEDITGSTLPTDTTLLLWGVGLGAFIVIIGAQSVRARRVVPLRIWQIGIVMAVVIELWLAGQALPYNDLAPPEVYNGQRFTISQLLAYGEDQTPPGRVLAISEMFFDPGDKEVLEARYRRAGMDDLAVRQALVATKRQELLFPNLSLKWGIPSVDGFGGGLLPTTYYSQFTSLMLPEGVEPTRDGRLGEMLALPECRGACIPDWQWLSLTNTQYIITDKVYDVWHEGVAYDTNRLQESGLTQKPGFAFDEVRILTDEPLSGFEDRAISTSAGISYVTPLSWQEFDEIQRNHVDNIMAVTVVDTRTGDFYQVQTGWKRVLSSDIKIYRLLPESIRAYLSSAISVVPDTSQGDEEALELLVNAGGGVIHGDTEPLANSDESVDRLIEQADILDYTPTHIEVRVTHDHQSAYLILADAYYPGWKATVNGEPVEIYRANIMLRAVQVPAGESTVVFTFEPDAWYTAIAVGAAVWQILLLGILFIYRRSTRSSIQIAE